MSIIIENQSVNAGIRMNAGELMIEFTDDPSFVRSESVIVDLMQRSIGIIFENTYHHLGELPNSFSGREAGVQDASLSGFGANGREIRLHAPIRFIRKTA